jgi:hypothetical protein
MASFALAVFSGVSPVCIYWLVLLTVSRQPSGADTAAYGFGMLILTLATALCEIAALGIGVAGTLQRRRKRALALLGVACGDSFLVIHDQTGFGRLVTTAIAFFTKVHTVRP